MGCPIIPASADPKGRFWLSVFSLWTSTADRVRRCRTLGRRGTLCEMGPDHLETERLVLEPLSLDHSEGMFLLWSDPEVCRYAGPIHDYEGRPVASPVHASSDSDRIIDFWVRAHSDGWDSGGHCVSAPPASSWG